MNAAAQALTNTSHTNSDAWKPLIHKPCGQGRSIYVLKHHYPQWQKVQQNREASYYLCTLFRAIVELQSKASRSMGEKTLKFEAGELSYLVFPNGDIGLYDLNIHARVQFRSGEQATALYQVKSDGDIWKTDSDQQGAMDLNHQWNGAHYAAVAGKFEDKEAAGKKLIEHIEGAFKGGVNAKQNQHYSLYWQQGQYQSQAHSNDIVALIDQAKIKHAKVNWLVQGEGAGTFVNALKTISKQASTAQKQGLAGEVNHKQQVYFSNPRGHQTSKDELKKWSEKAGLRFIQVNINPYDLKNHDARQAFLKTITPIVGIGTVVTANNLAGGELSKSALESIVTTIGATSIQETAGNIAQAYKNGSGSLTALLAVGGSLLAFNFVNKYKDQLLAVPKGMKGTWGDGNQQWYQG